AAGWAAHATVARPRRGLRGAGGLLNVRTALRGGCADRRGRQRREREQEQGSSSAQGRVRHGFLQGGPNGPWGRTFLDTERGGPDFSDFARGASTKYRARGEIDHHRRRAAVGCQ